MSQALAIRMDAAAVDRIFDGITADCLEAGRPAAQAMAQVLYEGVLANVARLKRHTGNLAGAIYQAFSRDNSNDKRFVYHVSWNARKAPHGHLVEWGHLQRYEITYNPATQRFMTHKDRPLAEPRLIAARPFVRPVLAKAQAALDAGEARYLAELKQRGVTA